ncbi:MAG: cation:proton antiporter [Thermoanaerobaculia bacterium]
MTPLEISLRVLLQLAVILTACRIVGRLVRPLGQPQVVAEMITGVLLGPSLLGAIAPGAQGWLFPAATQPVLQVLAHLGLALYMFLVGLEVDLGLIRQRARSAAAVSWAGILVPFCLGAALALPLVRRWPLFAPEVESWQAMLFLGAALSITAFPMLARIIYERGLSGTSLGVLALAAGALNDAAAWGLLALVLAGFTGDGSIVVLAVGGGTLYAVLMVAAGRRWLARGYAALLARPERRSLILPTTLVLVCLAAALTDALGVHAVLGAFILGACMPRGALQKRLESEIAPLTTVFLLPIFFVNSGLNTAIGLLDSWSMWGVALLVLAAAVLGKGVACAGAALAAGAGVRDSIAIGALMNARGLMELVLLNIAYERGLIGQTLFTMLVLMAVVTTLMAVPFFNRVYPHAVPPEDAAVERT